MSIILLSLCVSLVIPVVASQTSDTVSLYSSGTIYYEPYSPPNDPPPYTPPTDDLPPDDPPSHNPALQVEGTHLEDGNGETIYLVGAQADWNETCKKEGGNTLASNPEESWFTESDLQTMKANGATYFEAHLLLLKDLMPTRGRLDTSYLSTWIDKYCNWASNNQMYVVLDLASPYGSISSKWKLPNWFWDDAGYAEPTTDAQMEALVRDFFDTDVADMNVIRQAIETLWAGMANRYKNNPYVLFSIFNEPLMGVDCIDASTSQHLGETYSEFMEDIVDAIHATGATNIIIIDRHYATAYANYYNNVQPVNRDGIVWEDHYYMTSNHPYSGGQYGWTDFIDTYVARIVGTLGKPLIIGEYGYDPQDYGKDTYPSTWLSYLQSMVNYMDSKSGICGRQWHHWGAFEGEYFDHVFDWYTASESQAISDIVLNRPVS